MRVDEVVKKAEEVLEQNFVQEPPVDIYDLAGLNGLEVVEKVFPDELSHISGLIANEDSKPRVYVNLSDAPNRQKFTVAHELGHWLLHADELSKNPNLSILFRIAIGELNKDPWEREANIFAANLLVPLPLLGKYRNGKTNEELASLFGVSKDVIGYRLDLLKRNDHVATQSSPTSTK